MRAIPVVILICSIGLWIRSYVSSDSIRYETGNQGCTRCWYASAQSAVGSICLNIQRHRFNGTDASPIGAMYGINAGFKYVRGPAAMDMNDYCKAWAPHSRCATYVSGAGFFLGRNGWDRKVSRWTGQAPSCDDVAQGLVVGIPFWFIAVLSQLPLALRVRQCIALRVRGPGHCVRCGYDLRATPERCPECGSTSMQAAAVGPAA
jgi:hypothetical protein